MFARQHNVPDELCLLCLAGRVSMTCTTDKQRSLLLARYISVGIVVCGIIVGLVVLLVCRGRQIMTELANAKLNRIKRGYDAARIVCHVYMCLVLRVLSAGH